MQLICRLTNFSQIIFTEDYTKVVYQNISKTIAVNVQISRFIGRKEFAVKNCVIEKSSLYCFSEVDIR